MINELKNEIEFAIEYLYVYERETFIEMSMINIKREFRNQGYASLFMQRLCDYANQVNKPILLSPESSDDSDLNDNQLLRFYEKFGFRPNRGKIRDYSMPSHSYKKMPNE